jgi:hypothetical protein
MTTTNTRTAVTPLDAQILAAEGRLAQLARRRLALAVRAEVPGALSVSYELIDSGGVALLRVTGQGGEVLADTDEDGLDWDDGVLADLMTVARHGCPGIDAAGDPAVGLQGEPAATAEALLAAVPHTRGAVTAADLRAVADLLEADPRLRTVPVTSVRLSAAALRSSVVVQTATSPTELDAGAVWDTWAALLGTQLDSRGVATDDGEFVRYTVRRALDTRGGRLFVDVHGEQAV